MKTKMKIFPAVFFVGFFTFAHLAFGNVVTNERDYKWTDKLGRGAVNIVTSPVEIARSISIGSDEKNLLYGWTVGLLKGFGNGIIRFGAGVIDLVTFPFDFPGDKKEPLITPEYVWQKPGVDYA